MASTTTDINRFKLEPEPTVWKTVKRLGKGGFGEVDLEEKADGKQRALKRIRGRQTVMLKRELKTSIVVLERPDLFVEFLGWYELGGDTYFALEYMSEGDLGRYLEANGRQTEASTKEITKQILEGLLFLHEKRICHRDLKPENILLASKSPVRVKLTDFGLSKSQEGTVLRTLVGTQEYMAPEMLGTLSENQITRGSYTTAVDMWALGCLVHKFYTLKTPFKDIKLQSNPSSACSTETLSVTSLSSGYTALDANEELNFHHMVSYCNGGEKFPVDWLVEYKMSNRGIQFIKDLMVPYPASRITVADAMRSRWMSELPIDQNDIIRDQLSELGVHLSISDTEILIQRAEKSRQMRVPEYAPAISNDPTVLLGRNGLKLLLKSYGVDIKKFDPMTRIRSPRDLMHAAASAGYTMIVEMVFYLIPFKSDEDAEEEEGLDFRINDWTMLQLAAKKGHVDIVKFLVQKGANVNAPASQEEGGRTALQAAAENGHVETVRVLLDAEANIEAKGVFAHGRGALQAASQSGNLEIVNMLLDRGANVNMPPAGVRGRTALQAASEGGHLELVRLFVKKGAKMNTKISRSGGRTPIQAAAEGGQLEVVKFLLESDAQVNEEPCEEDGRTALQAAAEKGNLEMVEFLLENGADVNALAEDEGGELSALDCARKGGNMEVIKLLEYTIAK